MTLHKPTIDQFCFQQSCGLLLSDLIETQYVNVIFIYYEQFLLFHKTIGIYIQRDEQYFIIQLVFFLLSMVSLNQTGGLLWRRHLFVCNFNDFLITIIIFVGEQSLSPTSEMETSRSKAINCSRSNENKLKQQQVKPVYPKSKPEHNKYNQK